MWPVQIPAASDIPTFLSAWGSPKAITDASNSRQYGSHIPRCAMNPAYEYALPTQVARLMAGPYVRTEHAGTHGLDAALPGHSQPGGYWGSIHCLKPPILAATQPLKSASLRSGALHCDDSHGRGGRDGSVPGTNSAPVYCTRREKNQQDSLGAQSNDCGSTFVVSPYMPPRCSARMMTHDETVIDSTGASTRSWDDDETPPPPLPPQKEVFGIHLGDPCDTHSARGSPETHVSQPRQWWHQMWSSPPVRTPPADSTDDSVQSAQQLMARLQRQLDSFRVDDLFLGRFAMLGAQKRRCGGALSVLFHPSWDDRAVLPRFSGAAMCVFKA